MSNFWKSKQVRFLFFLIPGIVLVLFGSLMEVLHYGIGFVTGRDIVVIGALFLLIAFLTRNKDDKRK